MLIAAAAGIYLALSGVVVKISLALQLYNVHSHVFNYVLVYVLLRLAGVEEIPPFQLLGTFLNHMHRVL